MLEFQNSDALRSLDAQQRLDWQRGYQVIDPAGGSNLATTGTGAYEVDVAAGDVNSGGSTVTCTAATVDLSTEVGSTPQMAVVYRDAAGDAQYSVGAAAARDPDGEDVRATFEPVAPSLYNVNGAAVAEVLLDQSVGDVTASELRDRRVPAELVVDTITASKLGGDLDAGGNSVTNAGSIETEELFTAPAGVRLTKTSAQSIPNDSVTELTWEAADERNASSDAFADLANDGITIPNDEYSVARVSCSISTAGTIPWELMDFRLNSAGFSGGPTFVPRGNLSLDSMFLVSDWVNVSSGDTFTVRFWHSEGTSQAINATNATWFAVEAY